MSDRMKKQLDININTNVDTEPVKKAEKELSNFFKKYDNQSVDFGIDQKSLKIDTKDFFKAITAVGQLENAIDGVRRSAPMMIKALNTDIEFASNVKAEFKNAMATFSDGSIVHGFDEIASKISDGFSVVAVDLGGRVQYLKEQISGIISEFKSIDAIRSSWNGGIGGFDNDDMSQTDLRNRIDLLKKMAEYQQELETFSGKKFTYDDAPTGLPTNYIGHHIKSLEKDLNNLEDYNSQVEKQYQITTKQLERRKELIAESEGGMYWNSYDQDEAKKNIKDDAYYEQNLSELRGYISDREFLIAQLKESESELFRVDGVDKYISNIQEQIVEYKNFINELESLRNNNGKGTPIGGDFSEVINQLKEIKNVINEIKAAFQPLTDAFANGDSALSKMLSASVEDLTKLETKLSEVYQMINTISNKQFNVQNIISSGSNTQNDLEQIRQFRKEAKELYKQVEELYGAEAANTVNTIKRMPGGLQQVIDYQGSMADFDLSDLAKRIKSRSATSLGIVIDELNEWKKVLLQFNNLRNNVEAGSFNVDKYTDTSSKVRVGNKTTDKEEKKVVDESAVDNTDILNKVKTLSGQIETELTSIRSKMEETFNFATISTNHEHIKGIIDGIYQQFVELQAKINALDLNLNIPAIVAQIDEQDAKKAVPQVADDGSATTSASKIDAEAQAMQDVANEAGKAAQAKEKFANANKNVANSATSTSGDLQKEQQEFKETAETAEDSAKRITMVQQAIGNLNNAKQSNIGDVVKLKGFTQADFENYANEVAKSKGLTVGDISVSMGENGNMMVASVQMLNEELAQSITYTYKLMELEEGITEAYLTGYKAKGNQNKALKIAAAEQKKADVERLKADKERAKNNEWLIKQQSKLDTQERRYKHSNKSVDGSTALMSTETSLEGAVPEADKTIDTLAKHIRERIQGAVGGTLTDDLKEQILNDIRILQNEIAVAQNNKYSATNMKASSVKTSVDAYKQYLNAFEANAKKGNVFGQMEAEITSLRRELDGVTDSATLDKFIDKLKVARNKLTAEKTKYASQSKDKNFSLDLEKQLTTIIKQQAQWEKSGQLTDEVRQKIDSMLTSLAKVTNSSELSAWKKQWSIVKDEVATTKAEIDTTSQAQKEETQNLNKAISLQDKLYSAKKQLAKVDAGSARGQELTRKINEYQEEYDASLKLLENEENRTSIQERQLQLEKELTAIRLQSQNSYGKTIYNRESRHFDTIAANRGSVGDNNLSDDFLKKVNDYEEAYKKLKSLREEIANNPLASDDTLMQNTFQKTALEVERLRKEILNTFKETQKFASISADSILGKQKIDTKQFTSAKTAMIDFAATVTDGKFQFEGFNAAGTEMYGTLDKGAGAIQQITVALDKGTDSLYAYQTGTKQIASSWSKLGGSLKGEVTKLVGMYLSLYDIIRYFRQGITYVKEIDLAMTELKKVTDETDASYNKFLKDASSTSSVIGSTVSDFTEATANFARLNI